MWFDVDTFHSRQQCRLLLHIVGRPAVALHSAGTCGQYICFVVLHCGSRSHYGLQQLGGHSVCQLWKGQPANAVPAVLRYDWPCPATPTHAAPAHAHPAGMPMNRGRCSAAVPNEADERDSVRIIWACTYTVVTVVLRPACAGLTCCNWRNANDMVTSTRLWQTRGTAGMQAQPAEA